MDMIKNNNGIFNIKVKNGVVELHLKLKGTYGSKKFSNRMNDLLKQVNGKRAKKKIARFLAGSKEFYKLRWLKNGGEIKLISGYWGNWLPLEIEVK